MRRDHLFVIFTLTVLFLLVLSFQSSSTQADWGGVYTTTTTASITEGAIGETVTASTTTTYDGGPVFLGTVDYYTLDHPQVVGSTALTSTLSVNDPIIEFTVTQDIDLQMLRLPIDSIDNIGALSSSVVWSIYEQGVLKVQGDLDREVIKDMITDGFLTMVPNSYQSTGPLLTLSSSSFYRLELQDSVGLVYNIPVGNSEEITLKDGTTELSSTPKLLLSDGLKVGSQFAGSGSTNQGIVLDVTTEYVLTYYSDSANNFVSSYDLIPVMLTQLTSYSLTGIDTSVETGATAQLQATLTQDTSPVSGEIVDFFIDLGYDHHLGSVTTAADGKATLDALIDQVPGTYAITARSIISGQQVSDRYNLTVTRPTASFSELTATGQYGSGTTDMTCIVISGRIKDNLDVGISTPIDLHLDFVYETTLQSDTSGYFSHTTERSVSVGSHVNYVHVVYTEQIYDVADGYADLMVSKGQLSLTISNITMEHDLQPAIIQGNVTDSSDDLIDISYAIDLHENDFWTVIDAKTTSDGLVNHSLASQLGIGNHLLRLRYDGSSAYNPISRAFNITIGLSPAGLITNLSSTLSIEYHGAGDFSGRVIDRDGLPVVNATVSLLMPTNYTQMVYTEVLSGTTDSTGWANLYHYPDPSFAEVPYFEMQAILVASHTTYNISSVIIPFEIVATDLSITIENGTTKYGVNSHITITTIDNWGYAGDEGTEVEIDIEGSIHTISLDDLGKAMIYHTYSTTGPATITVRTTDVTGFPYTSTTQVRDISVEKGDLIMAPPDYAVNRGSDLSFSGTVINHVGQAMSGVWATLYFEDSGEFNRIGITQSDVNGEISLTTHINQTVGNYVYFWSLSYSADYHESNHSATVSVNKVATIITAHMDTEFVYSQDVGGILRLTTGSYEGITDKNIEFALNDSQTSFSLITNATGHLDFTLPILVPEDYELTITFLEDDYYQQSSVQFVFSVIQLDSSLSWIDLADPVYLGQSSQYVILLQNQFGSPLQQQNITVNIGSDQFQWQTNDTGYLSFSHTFVEEGTQTIEIQYAGIEGIGNATLSMDIDVIRRTLHLDNSDIPAVIGYGDDIILDVVVSSTNELIVPDVSVEISWYNISSASYQLIASNTTVDHLLYNFPYTDLTTELSTSVILSISAQHQYYHPVSITVEINISQEDVIITTTNPEMIFNEQSEMGVYVTDSSGTPVADLTVELRDALERVMTAGVTNATGQAILYLIPDMTGLHEYQLVVLDKVNSYYAPNTSQITVNVSRAQPSLTLDITAISTGIIVTSTLEHNTVVYDLEVDFYIFDTVWVYLDTGTIITIATFQLLDTTEIRAVFDGNTDLLNVTAQKLIILQSPDLTASDMTVEYLSDVSFNMTADTQLTGFSIRVLIVQEGFIHHNQSYIFQQGKITDEFHVVLDMGTYQLIYEFPAQGLVTAESVEVRLDINPIEIQSTLTGATAEIRQYRQETWSFALYRQLDSKSYPLEGIETFLSIYVNNEWMLLASDISDYDGAISFRFVFNGSMGEYTTRIYTTTTPNMITYSHTMQTTVTVQTTLELVDIEEGTYTDGGFITMKLYLTATGTVLEDENVSLYINYSNASSLLGEGTANATGHVTFGIDPLLLPETYELEFLYQSNGFYGSSTFLTFYTVVEEQVNIDYSILHMNDTIVVGNVMVSDESGPITIGHIQYRFYDRAGFVISSDLVDIDSGSASISFPTTYLNEYLLVINYTDTGGRFVETSAQLELDTYRITSVEVVVEDRELIYATTSDFRVQLQAGNMVLSQFNVSVEIADKSYRLMSDEQGIVTIPLEVTPGSYVIEIKIPSNNFIIYDQQLRIDLEIKKGTMPFKIQVDQSDAIYYNSELNLVIVEGLLDNATYRYDLLAGDTLIDAGLLRHTNQSLVILSDVDVGNYTLVVYRVHEDYELTSTNVTLIIVPHRVNIDIEYTIHETIDVEVVIISGIDNNKVEVAYSYQILNSSGKFVFVTQDTRLSLPLSYDPFSLSILVQGNYEGSAVFDFDLDSVSTDTTDTTHQEVTTVTPSDPSDSDSGFTLAEISVVGMIILGMSSRSLLPLVREKIKTIRAIPESS